MFNFIAASISRILEPFAFSVLLFCHPSGGRDSLKKRKIREENEIHKGTNKTNERLNTCDYDKTVESKHIPIILKIYIYIYTHICAYTYMHTHK